MKKFLAVFLIAVVAMSAMFADEKATVKITARRNGFVDTGFYKTSDTSYATKVTGVDFGENIDGSVSENLNFLAKTNNPGAYYVKLYATGLGRIYAEDGDVVPLNVTLDGETYSFTAVPNIDDATYGTSDYAPLYSPLVMEIPAGSKIRQLTKTVGLSADFSNATAGSYHGYVTIEASAK